MALHDPAGLAYAVMAIICLAVAIVTWRRRAQSPTLAAALTLVMTGGCWWSVGLATTTESANQTVAAIAMLMTFPGPSVMIASLVCLGLAIARPQWAPRRGFLAALLVEPVLITLAGLTNPWHLLVYAGAGARAGQLTGPTRWTYGPIFWADTWYEYAEVAISICAIAWGVWRSSSAFRAQRLALLVGVLVPLAANAAYLARVFGPTLDLTPFGFTVTGTMTFYAIFHRDLFTFTPVARALIVDQIGDVVVVISPGGRVLDLNSAAVDLLRGIVPGAPTQPVGRLAQEVFSGLGAPSYGPEAGMAVKLADGPAEFQVSASPLIDRHRRALGTVYVARDVTEANALGRRLAAAHDQLVRQVQTIDLLRADLVVKASRDPLTGLSNRRHLVERFAVMLAAAQTRREPIAVVLFDIDKFKSINDDFGHLAGDAVLVGLARLMREQAPPDALVARWGGEEFFCALPGADAGAGLTFADDVRRRCELHSIAVAGRTIGCTLSGGVAAYPTSGTTMDDLFRSADICLYAAKNAGRNRVWRDPDRAPAAAPISSGDETALTPTQ